MKPLGVARRLLRVVPDYAKIAWWGLVRPNVGRERPLVVCQGVILRGDLDAPEDLDVLLSVRSDLRGWELPGGNPDPGEPPHDTLCREVREETGLRVAVDAYMGDYVRTGFRPHTARVYRCHVLEGTPTPSSETPVVRWFPVGELPTTLFPWYRAPLADALAGFDAPVVREEIQGWREVLAGARIDVRMRLSGDTAGSGTADD